MPRALASAWPRPNSESCVPWTSSVGAWMRSSTPAGLLRSSTAAISGVSVPVAAAVWYAAQMSARNRPQVSACCTAAGSTRGGVEARGRCRRRPRPAERVEQATGGRRARPEEQARPQPLVDAGVAVLGGGGHGLRVDLAGLGREEGRRQRVPGDLRRDGVDAVVVGGAEEGQRSPVRAARDADPRIAGAVELHVVALGEPVDQGREVGDLVPRVVQPDLAGAAAEAAGRVREDDVAALGQVAGVAGDRVLAAPEAVREDDGGGAAAAGWQVGRRVELYRVGAGAGGHARVLGADVACGGRRRSDDDGAGEQREGEQGGERRAGAGARAGTHEPAEGAHAAANGRAAGHVPPQVSRGQGVQSPVRTTTRPGAVTSAGSSKKRTAGPCSCGKASTSWTAAWRCVSSPSVKNTVLAATSLPV